MTNQSVRTAFMNLKDLVRKVKNNNSVIGVIMTEEHIFDHLVSVLLKKLMTIDDVLQL